jgi:hypothetical protein
VPPCFNGLKLAKVSDNVSIIIMNPFLYAIPLKRKKWVRKQGKSLSRKPPLRVLVKLKLIYLPVQNLDELARKT